MTVQNNRDLQALLRIGQLCGQALQHMLAHVEPGMTTKALDEIGEKFLKKHGAHSAPILAYQFPGYTCISINEEAAHGIPGERVIQPGDMVNIDVSAVLEGYWADTGASMIVPPIRPEYQRLCEFTQTALRRALEMASAGQRVNQIGKFVEKFARKGGYRVLKDLGGHGVGRHIHEPPSIPNYYDKKNRAVLEEGQVVTIEPFLNMGRGVITTDEDGWTLRTPDRSVSAQYEHTIIVTQDQPILLTAV